MEKYLFTNEQRSLMENMKIPFDVYQLINGKIVTLLVSSGFCEMFGFNDPASAYQEMENDIYKNIHPDDIAQISDKTFRFTNEGGNYEVIYRIRTKDLPEYKVIHATGKHYYTDNGVRLAHIWYTDEGN